MPDVTSLHVLLIDDDEDVVDLVDMMMTVDDRFRLVATTPWAAQGVVQADLLEPDAIVLDLHLGGTEGLEALPLLRRACPRAAIVVYSPYPDPFTLLSVLRRGADAYIDKAQVWAELLPTIVHACAEIGARQPAPH